jgi:hypothetical protein
LRHIGPSPRQRLDDDVPHARLGCDVCLASGWRGGVESGEEFIGERSSSCAIGSVSVSNLVIIAPQRRSYRVRDLPIGDGSPALDEAEN